ncbi:MAG: enoyl-[acyl-carrier-protein] reductase FabK [Clostridia bacterium]|nr:enoyl-[acyl-carrier-protein] reductase FabK [Clostridia bacterium]
MIKTPICDIFGIEYPIFQGGMAWIADASLASAVSNAGGLGIIAAGNAPADVVRTQIQEAKKLTDKPFGVNVMLMSPFADEVAKVVAEEKVAVVTTGAGNPSKYMPMWNESGAKVVPVVASIALAKLAERLGAAAVIAEGGESGGHVGELSTMPLVPIIKDSVSLPVLAAGGIVDGRGIAASFMLGAVGVQMGTRFLVAHECTVHPNYKKKVLEAKDIDSVRTGMRLGHPVRSIKTPYSRMMLKAEFDPNITNEQFDKMGQGSLRKAAVEGDEKDGCFLAGQCAALVKKEQSAKEIIEEIFAEAEEILKGADKWVK